MTNLDNERYLRILKKLIPQYGKGGLFGENITPATRMDIDTSFLKPVPKEQSLDNLEAPKDGSDNVE